jgi:acetone carboxylase, beta subunit
MGNTRDPVIITSDAGGTMTDIFAVDREGEFVIGKASTTPQDESIGFWESLADAFKYWGIDWEKHSGEVLPGVEACIYSGTAMLNVLLTRTGQRVGLIVTGGEEDILIHERAKQIYAGFSYADRLHKVGHYHNVPTLVPRKLVRGVTERITAFGEEFIPLYEREARQAVGELLDADVDSIVVCFYFSYLNPAHERRVAEIAEEVMAQKGRRVPVYLSGDVAPIMREVSRLNSTLLQAYAAEPGRKQLVKVESRLQERGYRYPLQIVLASGSVANIRYPRLHEAAFSGPIGGILGAQYLAKLLHVDNIVCTDVGGTSFDVGLVMGGHPMIVREVELAHHIFNIPTLAMDTIGAGTGMYLRVDAAKRLHIGPESTGADPGPVCYDKGNTTPTVMDCALICGIINPDYYLGGKLRLNKEKALKAVKEQCADRMGVNVYDFAEGVYDLICSNMREHIRAVLAMRGFSPADYHVLSYGGAGAMYMAGYTKGLPFKGILTVPFAAAFSAFGCAAVDYVHRYQKSTLAAVPPGSNDDFKVIIGSILNAGWEELEASALRDLEQEGFHRQDVHLQQVAYMRYGQQIDDLEVISPVRRISTADDMNRLINAFERLYTRVFAAGARYPEWGYTIMELGVIASAPKAKPVLREYPLEGREPSGQARKGERDVYLEGRWVRAQLYEMDLLKSGNQLRGPAVVEAPSTTLFIPTGKTVRMDEYRVIWMSGD